jgi:AraC-like DNA-binding protein
MHPQTSAAAASGSYPGAPRAVMYARFRPAPGRITMPDVCCDLVWVRERLFIAGPQSRGQVSAHPGEEIQLLNLDPLVARAWLGVPVAHLTDRKILLEDIDRDCAGRLSELFASGRAADLVGLPVVAGRAARAAASIKAFASVRLAAQAAELSIRQLERLFGDRFGLSPRRYGRILRLRRAIGAIKQDGESLAFAAAGAGYADQSHFTREVRELTGRSPRFLLPHVANVQEVLAHTRDD